MITRLWYKITGRKPKPSTPEFWAQEGLRILMASMPAASGITRGRHYEEPAKSEAVDRINVGNRPNIFDAYD